MNFENWLADLLGLKTNEVTDLLKDESALHFLIAWSLFESKCCGGYAKGCHLEDFSKRLIKEKFRCETISEAAKHFHQRYQDKELLKRLMQGRDKDLTRRMTAVLATPVTELKPEEIAFLVALVVYRFRNNIFHGTKGIPSWPKYKDQVALCTGALQAFVSHAESVKTSLKPAPAAQPKTVV